MERGLRLALLAVLVMGLATALGFFQVEVALAGCSAGEFDAGGGNCVPCPVGSFCSGPGGPQPCPEGTTSDGGATFCYNTVPSFRPDPDNDGINVPADNCPFVANPGQADTWGGSDGNACDRNYYDSGDGVKIFRLKASGVHQVFGDCLGEVCRLIAAFHPSDLAGLGEYPPDFLRLQAQDGSRWFVDIYWLGEDAIGNKVYQVNVYAPGGLLMDDGFVLFVGEDGTDFFVPHN
jgi:hypothetical protein